MTEREIITPNIRPESSNRLEVYRLTLDEETDTFARDVHAGLIANPKTLLPKYFYDKLGSHLFEAICELPEYYVTRAENEILREHIDEIISEIDNHDQRDIRLIELGSGNADKTRYFIQALLRRQKRLHYLPIDISAASLERSASELIKDYPSIRITAYTADYSTALQALAKANTLDQQDKNRNVVLFLGSSIGNLDPDETGKLLRNVRSVLHPNDVFFIGADLKKTPAILVPAYNDALGVTAAFNLNLLVRINRELEGDFDLAKFEHRAIYNERLGRIEMHLFSREPQIVRIRVLDLQVRFERGESIHTENSYKFDLGQLSGLAFDTGFTLEKTWFDGGRQFSFNLFSSA